MADFEVRPDHPFVRGWDAHAAGRPASANPHLVATAAGLQWAAGFDERSKMAGQGLIPPPVTAPAPWWVDR